MPELFTVGTSNRTIEEFLDLLGVFGIRQILDVRRFPVSSRYSWFSRPELERRLTESGFHYQWLGDLLGGYRAEGYEAYTQSRAFEEGIRRVEKLAMEERSCLICAERLPWRCHRLAIARHLAQRGWHVIHIIDKDHIWDPNRSSESGELFNVSDY